MERDSTAARNAPLAKDQAASWFARQRSGNWSPADESAFAAWLRRDAAHAEAWAELAALWDRLEGVRNDPAILSLREKARERAVRRSAWRSRWRVSAGVAASVLLASVLLWQLRPGGSASPAPATLAQAPPSRAGSAPLIRDASTRVGERSVLMLADGSRVTLNTASSVHVDYSGPERRVALMQGEAFFDVAKDRVHPFVVTVGAHQVIAVGTAFSVRLRERQLRVTLVEGRVRVLESVAPSAGASAPASAPVTLEAGSALIADDDGTERVQRLDAARATSWRSGKLIFEGERLADVVAEMNRYSVEKLEIATAALGERRVSGVFESSGGPSFAQALQAYGVARATRVSPTVVMLSDAGRN